MVLYQRRRGEFLVLRVIYVPWPHPGVAPAPYPEPSAEDWEIAAELMED
jgi:hypothetical protein